MDPATAGYWRPHNRSVTSSRSAPAYPFTPKSTSYLLAGQFWAVPMRDGRFACGRVLQVTGDGHPWASTSTRTFLAGLLDWSGDEQPTAESIAGASLLLQGKAHIKAITTTGGVVLGHRPLEADHLRPYEWLSARVVNPNHVFAGLTYLREASREDQQNLPVMSTWGFKVIQVSANSRLARP